MTLHTNTRITEWIRSCLGRGSATQQGCPQAGDAEPTQLQGQFLQGLDEGSQVELRAVQSRVAECKPIGVGLQRAEGGRQGLGLESFPVATLGKVHD